jgi:signal transduction histidine kinase
VEKLVEQTREAGLPTRLTIEGEASPLPAGIDLTAYRLVQEGLTNALKHARATHAEVHVRYADGTVELGHPHVHQDDVRCKPLTFRNRLEPIRRFAHHFDVLLGFEDHAEACSDERLVVHDQDAQAHSGATGRRARNS